MRNNRLDYRLYQVEPPSRRHAGWAGFALVKGMPDFAGAGSEGDLRQKIDAAHARRLAA